MGSRAAVISGIIGDKHEDREDVNDSTTSRAEYEDHDVSCEKGG